jgi:outer membrane immunogenic protein
LLCGNARRIAFGVEMRMKSVLAALVVVAATLGTASGAHAQSRLGPYVWQGPYVGANLGYQWSSISANPTRPNGFIGGVQAGYNWQSQQFVFGAETDLQFSGADDTFAPWKFSNPWFGTLRGRAGFLLNNNTLFYATAGLAYGSLHAQNAATGVSETKVHPGWTVGIGAEMALTGNWSAKIEYLYINLYDRAYAATGANNGMDASVLRMGVNFRF